MGYFCSLILIILIVFHLSSIMKNAFLSYKKIEGTSHIHEILSRLKCKNDKRYRKRLIIWSVIFIVYCGVYLYAANTVKNIRIEGTFAYFLIVAIILWYIYCFAKPYPDISDILEEYYKFHKVGNQFERNDKKERFRYDVAYSLSIIIIHIPMLRIINTEYTFELDKDVEVHDLASYRKLTDHINSFSQLESKYIAIEEISPSFLHKYMPETDSKRQITIKMK